MNLSNNMKFENEMELSLRSSASNSKLNSHAEDIHQNQSQLSRQLKQQEIIQSSSSSSKWSPEENKMFENALAVHDEDSPDKWVKVAAMIPGKTVSDVMKQYQELEADVSFIEAGLVPLPPGYTTSTATSTYPAAAAAGAFTLNYWVNGRQQISSSSSGYDDGFGVLVNGGCGKRLASVRGGSEQDRKKGVPWTEEEHKLFLLGLNKYGKGDWRNISRNFVITRTPTQVASHAQKYFVRQHSGGKDKRRASIHDITIVNLNDTHAHSPDHLPSGKQPHSPGMPYQWSNSSYGKGSAATDFNNDAYGFNSSMHGQGLHTGASGMLDSHSTGAFQMQSGMHYPHN